MASVPSFGGSSSDPTIHTVPGDGATPASRMSDKKLPVVGFGLGATLHALPFQFISSVLCWPEPFAKEEDPNAQISVGDTAVIPCRLFDWNTLFGPMLGLVTTLQLAPSQCSISVNVAACFGGATGVEKPTEEEQEAGEGSFVYMPPNLEHGIKARNEVVMVL